jgi:hypothetical protein
VLYYGSQHVHRTRDKGVTWETISPDLTANPSCCQGISGEPITRDITGEEFYSTLYAIVESPHEAGVIWTGANDGPFHITRDNGRTWRNITPKDLPPGGRVAWIEASPHRRGSAYFAVHRYLLGDYSPYLYRTDDYGATWKRLTDGRNGIPIDWPTRVVREDPDREGLLYAGTEFGMFVSLDNGAHWQSFQLNLPNVPINDIRVHRKDLVVATQGRAMWIIDDLSPLHQVTPQVAANAAHLFSPRDGYRTRSGAEYLSPTVQYFLPAAPAGPVTIEILDGAGQPVNRYSSETPAPSRPARGGGGDPDDPASFGGRSAGVVSRVTKEAGLNRFIWDLRHSSGVGAPPGQYQVRLILANTTMTEPLTVLIDPRLAEEGVTMEDLREQFDHNLRMRELVAAAARAVTRVRQAEARLQNATGPAADTLTRVRAIAGTLITEPVRYGKPGLQAHITYLNGMTNAVDQKIGRDAIARYQVLKREFDTVRAELDRVLGPGSTP